MGIKKADTFQYLLNSITTGNFVAYPDTGDNLLILEQ